MKSLSVALVIAGVLLAGCTQNEKPQLTLQDPMSLAPRPVAGQEAELANRLNRYLGQTDFLTLGYNRALRGGLESAQDVKAAAAPGGRQEQESDVFKVGNPGSKLLYLLNSSRGLQIISYAKGVDQPELVGRVNPTGNGSDTMYSDLERGRLMVLENVYRGDARDARIVVYDVKDPKKPYISDMVEVEGRIVDSRIVGDVLYVATHQITSNQTRWGWSSQKVSGGKVQSYNLKGDKIAKVQEVAMQLPITHGELMNIQNEGDKYYLVGVQSESGWLWWDRQSAVEVIDISSPTGKIETAMTVYAKGRIGERSQTKIHNGYLVVTSNYTVNPTDRTPIARVAVEAFKLPGEQPDVLTEDEAEYRRLHIERILAKTEESKREEVREQLLKDAELGLKGRFIRLKNGSLKKLVADSAVTSGDTTGLSASLQDVRYQDNLLYVFWVPANMADPLDVFNLGDLEKGVKYEGRLEYEGWVARSFPMTYKGRKFIIGLGWIVENANNENMRRYPQAIILEVKNGKRRTRDKQTGEIREVESIVFEKVPGAQVTMKADEHVWANLNTVDREIEVRMDTESRGEILFSAYKWGKNTFSEGGQLIRFDLEEAYQGFGETALEVGPFLQAPASWLRRVFVNKEIGMINAFATENLSTFNTQGLKAAQSAKAVSVLELARNITSYFTLQTKDGVKGVQVIQSGDYRDQKTGLRVVDARNADAEKKDIQAEAVIPGSLVDAVKIDGGKALLVLTSKYEYTEKKTTYTYNLARVELTEKGEVAVDQRSWDDEVQSRRVDFGVRGSALTPIRGGKVLVSTGGKVQLVEEGKSLNPQLLSTEACPTGKDLVSVELKEVSGRLVFVVTENFEDQLMQTVQKKSIVTASLEGQTLKCGVTVNIPGEPVMFVGDQLVTQDRYSKDTQVTYEEYEQRGDNGEIKKVRYQVLKTLEANAFTLVQVKGTAVLRDITSELNTQYGTLSGTQLQGTSKLYFLKTADNNRYEDAQLATLEVESGRLVSSTWALQGVTGYANLVNLAAVKDGQAVAVISTDGSNRVYRVEENRRPEVIKFRPVKEDGTLGEPTDKIEGYIYGKVHYTPGQNSLEIASGLRGIIQLFL